MEEQNEAVIPPSATTLDNRSFLFSNSRVISMKEFVFASLNPMQVRDSDTTYSQVRKLTHSQDLCIVVEKRL